MPKYLDLNGLTLYDQKIKEYIAEQGGEVNAISNNTIDSLFGYAITTTVTNGSTTGDTFIPFSGTASLVITPSSGYYLPQSITVTGASYTYDSVAGTINLSNPTGSISISAVCDNTPSGYSVSVSSINTSPYGYGKAYYSINNGATWIEITSSGLLTSNATQIKFKVTTEASAMETAEITCQSLNVNIESYDSAESDNITLTANVSDVVVYFNDND